MASKPNKTRPEPASVDAFLAAIEHPTRRADALVLRDLFARVTGLSPQMWGTDIVGFGRYHYKYATGREGDYLMTGFSPRKAALSIYIMPGYRDLSAELERLGKQKVGKSCLYINKLADVDLEVLAEIITAGMAHLRAKFETCPE